MNHTRNMIVTCAGYQYIGHFHSGNLRIVLETPGCGCSVRPKDIFSLYELFKVFDIDAEDGVMLESIQGKSCRVIFNEEGYPVMLQHIILDDVVWEVK